MDKLAILQAAIKHNTKELHRLQAGYLICRDSAKSGQSETPTFDRYCAEWHRKRLLRLMKVQKGLRRLIAQEVKTQRLYRAARKCV